MTALDNSRIRRVNTPIGQTHATRFIGLMKDTGVVYPGAIMMQRTGDDYAQIVTKVADGTVLGWADIPFPIDTADASEDGEQVITIRDGIVGPLDTLGSGDTVDDGMRNKIVYMENDNTVAKTTDTAARSCPVRVDRVDSEGIYIVIGREQV